MKTMWRKTMVLTAVVAVSMLAFGCSDDDESNPMTSPANSRVTIVHASPDAPGVDIYVDGAQAVTNLTFPSATGYVELPSGTRSIAVNVTGTGTTVIAADLKLDPNTDYSVFAIDEVSEITALVLEDNLSSPAAGKSHVRFIHLSPDAPAVDVALAGGAVLFSNVAFSEYIDFTPLDAGTYDLEVRLAGTNTVVLPLPGITLTAGKIYTVFAKGFVSGSGATALGAEIVVNN